MIRTAMASRAMAGSWRWREASLAVAVIAYGLLVSYLWVDGQLSLAAFAVGGPIWLAVAYRYPMAGIAILAAGQFLLRSLVGGVTVLSRDASSGSTLAVGGILLLPLAAAALAKGDWRRLVRVCAEQRMIMWPLALVSAAVVLGYLISPSSYGQLKLIAYIGLNLPLFILPLLLLRTERDAKLLVIGVVAVSLVTLGASFFGNATIWEQSGLRGSKATVEQLGNQSVDIGIWLGRRLALGALAAIAVLLMTRSRKPYFYWLAAVTLFAGLVLAASRGPALAALVALLVMILAPRARTLGRRARLASLLVIGAATVVAFTYLPPQLVDRYQVVFRGKLADRSFTERINVFGYAVELIDQSPLTGVGLGGFSMEVWGVDRAIYPHNLTLEFAAELGIPVAVLFLVMVAGGIRSATVGVRRSASPWFRAVAVWALGMQIATFIDAQLSGDLRTNEHIWFAAGLATATAYLARSWKPVSDAQGAPSLSMGRKGHVDGGLRPGR